MILSLFTVAKAILEVLMVLPELNVIRSALVLLCLELQQQSWHKKVKDLGIRLVRFPRDKECTA